MSQVNTVLGPVDSSKLGRTLMHEHLLVNLPGVLEDPLVKWDMNAAVQAVTRELQAVKRQGISTVVDANPIAMGRHTEFLKKVAEASGINVIASTGFFNRRYFPGYFANMTVEQLAAIMECEVTKSMQNSNARAGIIKVATMSDIVEAEEKALRAAGRVSQSAGVPIITHTDGILGLKQLDIFESEGADPAHIVIGHTCCSSDIRYQLSILKRGAYVGFDRIGWDYFQLDEVRLVALIGLIGAGYGDKIIMSMDLPVEIVGGLHLPVPRKELKKLTYLNDEFIPRLIKAGVKPQTIEHILVDNPRRIFEQ